MATGKDKQRRFEFTKEQMGEMKTIDGPCQMAIIVPMIPAEEEQEVDVAPFTVALRDSIEGVLLKNNLLYRGVALKIMRDKIPQVMVDELIELREYKKDLLTDRREELNQRRLEVLGRVRRAWGEMWKTSK